MDSITLYDWLSGNETADKLAKRNMSLKNTKKISIINFTLARIPHSKFYENIK